MSLKQKGIDLYVQTKSESGLNIDSPEFREAALALMAKECPELPFARVKALYNLARTTVEGDSGPKAPRAHKAQREHGGDGFRVVHGIVVKSTKSKKRDDLDSFTVIEVINTDIREGKLVYGEVGRTYSYSDFDVAKGMLGAKLRRYNGTWKLIRGLGPNPGEEYRLTDGEEELS